MSSSRSRGARGDGCRCGIGYLGDDPAATPYPAAADSTRDPPQAPWRLPPSTETSVGRMLPDPG